MVTGSITIAGMDPRQFCQTFFLARQHQDNDRHNYFVRNDIFRFLDVLPEVVQVCPSDAKVDTKVDAKVDALPWIVVLRCRFSLVYCTILYLMHERHALQRSCCCHGQ